MDKKIILGVVVVSIVILIGGIFVVSDGGGNDNSGGIVATADAKVEVNEANHEWGEIGINDGNVEKEFSIKNSGTEPLSLYNVNTSCMCTTAQLSLENEKSPEFGMHDKSTYVMSVPPGKTAKLKVVFDPAFHGPSGVGPITRQVNIATNDANKSEITFMLTAMVRN